MRHDAEVGHQSDNGIVTWKLTLDEVRNRRKPGKDCKKAYND